MAYLSCAIENTPWESANDLTNKHDFDPVGEKGHKNCGNHKNQCGKNNFLVSKNRLNVAANEDPNEGSNR